SDITPNTEVIVRLYNSSGINRSHKRITKMYANSNLTVTAWDKNQLVGISRSLTDFCYCCYLADLSVREEYKHRGIGIKLIQLTKEIIGDQTMLWLLAAPSAIGYYPKVCFEES